MLRIVIIDFAKLKVEKAIITFAIAKIITVSVRTS